MEFKTNLTEQEFREVKDLVCQATLHNDVDVKQWFLLKIGGIMVGGEDKFIESAEDQGYNINRGVAP